MNVLLIDDPINGSLTNVGTCDVGGNDLTIGFILVSLFGLAAMNTNDNKYPLKKVTVMI